MIGKVPLRLSMVVAVSLLCVSGPGGWAAVPVPPGGTAVGAGALKSGGSCGGQSAIIGHLIGPIRITMAPVTIAGTGSIGAYFSGLGDMAGGCFALSIDVKSILTPAKEIKCPPSSTGTFLRHPQNTYTVTVPVEICDYYFIGKLVATRGFQVNGVFVLDSSGVMEGIFNFI